MSRFQKPTPIIYTAIVLSMAAVLVADIFTPLGVAVWVFYLLPMVLSLFVWRPMIPFWIAGIATLFIIACYIFDHPGLDVEIARLNRGFGISTVWAVGVVTHFFIRNKISVRRQNWLQSGQTALNAELTGELTIEKLGENALRFLAEYLNAQAGAMFVDRNGGLRRVATYAVAGSAVPEHLNRGEGLLGQAVKDSRTFVLDDVPDGYLAVGSALGHSRPRHLIIKPVAADGLVNCVFELGFTGLLDKSTEDLLSHVAESLAIAVRSSNYRSRLQDLLEQTQQQSEELKTQSEELKVSNEELEEQSRALKETQVRLEHQQAELEQINVQLEEQTTILENQKDELTRSKDTLETNAQELKQASRYKTEFLSNMSHELRTPLNSSLIFAKLLSENRNGNLTAEQVKYAETIYASGNDLLTLINDVLDLSKVEAGRLEISPEETKIDKLLQNLNTLFKPLADQKALSLSMQFLPGTPKSLETDGQRLEQILKNLLSNAIKFTEKGSVRLDVGKSDNKLSFAVHDTGIGIAEQQLQVVFEPFRQADGTTHRKYGGTGLGLSISRELARLLGGEIQLSSTPGVGTTFTVLLSEKWSSTVAPIAAASAPLSVERNRAAVAPSALKTVTHVPDDRSQLTGNSRLILIVEDDVGFAGIVYDLAHELGFQGLIATTGEDGLILALQYLPSAIVLDIGLPDRNGLTVLDRLKYDVRTRHIPVHVVSAGDFSELAMAMGAIGYMLKPVRREQLAEALLKLEGRLAQKLRRVLVVEDDPALLESMCQLLGSRDVQTQGVRNAADCLKHLQSETFDCMVLDLSLPDASGFSLLETLSSQDAYSFPPVIVYTGRELSADDEQRLRRYSKSIIIKGAKSPERLLDEVTLFLHQVVSELPANQQKMLEHARSRDNALNGKSILVAEDDVRNIYALTSILEPCGASIRIARNGREAVKALEEAQKGTKQSINLVLMDIMMPEMDGLTAIREIRKRSEWRKLPIIALTAKAMKNDHDDCIRAGANDYMAKPLDVDKLLSLIRVWMPR